MTTSNPTRPEPCGRALATVSTLRDIRDIPGADNIVVARVRGWDVVVKRGQFTDGALCVYLEVDSLLDVADERFEFLTPRGVRTDAAGVYGHVLKTARLRGQYSQGLAFPLTDFPELDGACDGDDVTAELALVKWEAPLPACLVGQVRGMRPGWIPTTDEDRVQNVPLILSAGGTWVATEKIDGTSTTIYVDPVSGVDGVCSRNLDLLNEGGNTLWAMATQIGAHDLLRGAFPGARVALQGETYGEGIQANPLRVRGQHFAAFTLRVEGAEIPRDQWPAWLLGLSVPVRDVPFPTSVAEALAQVETLRSALSPDPTRPAEGLVWRALGDAHVILPDGSRARESFKVVSNRYLLKNDL